MKIALSGPPGSGTTTLARSLCEYFDLEHISSGDIFRSLAEEKGMSLSEFSKTAEEDHAIDRQIDQRQRDIAKEKDQILLEGRLSGWVVEEVDLRIYLDAPLKIRAKRVAKRENKETDRAYDEIKEREESEAKRYSEIYDIDIEDLSPYDLIINTGVWNSEQVVEISKTAINFLKKE